MPERVRKALLDGLERCVAVARDRPSHMLELTELRPVERLDLRPQARLVHLQSMILQAGDLFTRARDLLNAREWLREQRPFFE